MKQTSKIMPMPKQNYMKACRRHASKPEVHILISQFTYSSRLLIIRSNMYEW